MANLPRARQPSPPSDSWKTEFDILSEANDARALTPEELERLAVATYMVGDDDACAAAWLRAHQEYASAGDPQRAARCAFWQACGLLFRGDLAPAQGWIARGRRMLEAAPPDCAEQGWLLVMTALPALFDGDGDTAHRLFDDAAHIAARFSDVDLTAFVRLGQGQALILQQRVEEGLALLDEVMVAVLTDKLSPILTGIVYCSTIDTCHAIFDLRRAREWTDALSRWCASQPGLVPYRGNCLILRCEIFKLQGEWSEAIDAARGACELLSGPPTWDTLGSAHYQLGDIQRLRGQFAEAEAAYRAASRAGRDPEPGLSLLHLAQGRVDLAAAAIRRALNEARDSTARFKLLPTFVEVMLEAGELDAAREAAEELRRIEGDLGAPLARALAIHAAGAVALAEGRAQKALAQLRAAGVAWQALDMPYELARVRVLVGLACRELGDRAGASLEFDAARSLFTQLGATPDLGRLRRIEGETALETIGPLSPREREVLVLVASGKSNRSIADALYISEKTVARHVSNIFAKLDVSSRTEAAAYAHKHGILQ
jgi:DNA-binding CsgD family transcriptional regulator